MAICVQLNESGQLVPTGDDPATCPAYVLLSGSEYSLVGAINTALGVPSVDEAIGWFTGPFLLVGSLFVWSRGAGAIANMFRGK